MTEADAIEAISKRWSVSWSALQPAIPFVFDNEADHSVDSWARVSIQPTSSRQISMGPAGTRRFERRGNIFVQLFGALNVGRAALATLAADVRTTFEAQTIATAGGGGEPIVTYAASMQDVSTDERWSIVVATVPFSFVETR